MIKSQLNFFTSLLKLVENYAHKLEITLNVVYFRMVGNFGFFFQHFGSSIALWWNVRRICM